MLAKQIKSTREEEEEVAKLWCFAEGWEKEEERRERKMFRLALAVFRCPDVNGHEVTSRSSTARRVLWWLRLRNAFVPFHFAAIHEACGAPISALGLAALVQAQRELNTA